MDAICGKLAGCSLAGRIAGLQTFRNRLVSLAVP